MGIFQHSSLLLLFITSVTCCGISMPYGNMTKDFDLLVNETLTIQCTLSNTTIHDNNIDYFVSSKDLYIKFKLDHLDVKIIDDVTIEYSINSATVNDTGLYSCYVNLPKVNRSLLICSTYASVGYKPHNVQNFTCVSYEFRILNCSWVNPFNPIRTDYTLYDFIHVELLKRQCPERINDTSCGWTMYSRPQYRRSSEKLYFLMIGNNSLGQVKQRMSMEHYKIVIPGKVENVLCTNITQTSLVMHWNAPRDMDFGFPPGLQYSVQYQPTFRPDYEKTAMLMLHEGSKIEMLIEDLVPNTEYKFSIRSRSSVVDNDDYWSSEVSIIEGTKPDVPYLAPEIIPSSFDMETVLGNRTITLYWKAIPTQYENGRKFQYVIEYHIHHVPSRKFRSHQEVPVGNKTTFSFQHLDTHSAYMFKLYAINEIGRSLNTSEIIIDKSEKLLDKPKDIIVVSYSQGKYNLSWKTSNQRPYNFTVFWCKSLNPRPWKCEGPLEWLHTTKTRYTLQLPDKTTNYQFAVSANGDGFTSGMSWASCIVDKEVKYKVKRVELAIKTATSLKLQWSLDCEAQKIVMKEYAIQYCEFNGSCAQAYALNKKSCTDWKTVNVSDVSKEDYILGSLKPFTQYVAFMRAHTLSGWSSDSNLACERTMETAPDDPPRNIKVTNIDGKDISLSFKPPSKPNGKISHYVAYYNKSDGTFHHVEFRVNDMPELNGVYAVDLNEYTAYYTNYSIELVACVHQACSIKSEPVYAFTDISNPDIIRSPRIEVTKNNINISWDNPLLSNGPLNYFQVLKEGNNSSKGQVFNVSGQNYLLLSHNCSENEDDKIVYKFRVRAVNIKNGVHLLGRYSPPTKTILCSSDIPVGVIVGIVVGSTVGIIIVMLIIYSLYSWMKNEVEMIKGIQIQLPKDLDSPMENPLSSYDKFKNGLQTNHDSGIPCDTSYERLCTFNSDEVKNIGRVIDENNGKSKRKSSGRNNSGESTASGKCHDSISSSNTTKTHLSIDSGAEVDSPPSPDGLFSDTSSSHTTPRSYKPDLTIVRECNGSTSKDSGLDKDGSFINHTLPDLPSKFTYFVKKRNSPYSNIQITNGDARMPSYSKFAVPSFVPYGEQSMGLLENSLSNSEPSVADFDAGNIAEPLVPYCKFGLARSAGNGLNVANQSIINNKVGYSKFGTVYRALKPQDGSNIPTFNASLNTCPKFLPHNPQTFIALTNCNDFQGKHRDKDNDRAYSKFGVSCPKKVPVNGYVSFRDTLTYPCAESFGANQAYSKVGMGSVNEKNSLESDTEHIKENGIIMNPAELPVLSSRTSYVPFQNAKIMNLNDSSSKENLIDSFNKEDPCGKINLGISNSEPDQYLVTKSQIEKENSIDNDIDCIISTDSSPSLLDEIASDLGNKLKPTNCIISANNDSKGFLIQDESVNQPTNQLTSIMDALFGTYDFNIAENSEIEPICINMDDIDIANSSTFNNINDDGRSISNLTVESSNFCKQCNNLMTNCSCSSNKGTQVGVICNGHSSSIQNDYVPLSCNSSC